MLLCSLGYCECDGYTVDKLSQRRLTADLLVSRESDCSWMRSKSSSDLLPSYITAKRPVLEILKMAGYRVKPKNWKKNVTTNTSSTASPTKLA